MIRAALVLLLVASGGCKKKANKANDFDSVFRTMRQVRDDVCKCKDQACARAVMTRMSEWVQRASTDNAKPPEPTSTQRKEMTVVSEDLSKCLTKLMAPNEASPLDAPRTDAPSVVDAPPPIDAPPPRGKLPEPVPAPVTVDALLASARTWARGEHDQLRIADLNVRYIDASGALDPDSGYVTIELGRAPMVVDDPKRRTGVPVKQPPEQPTSCMKLDWTPARGWFGGYGWACGEAELPFPRCSVETIWKRAIALGAPADAVARLYLREGKPRRWAFTITDEPRGVKIRHYIDDDCEMTVEKP